MVSAKTLGVDKLFSERARTKSEPERRTRNAVSQTLIGMGIAEIRIAS